MLTTFLLVAQATAFSVAAFPATATSPATGTPLAAPVTYPLASLACNQPKESETLPIVNPDEGRVDDPANPTTRDCAIPIAAQFVALPAGTGFRAAYRVVAGTAVSAWSAFSTPFAITVAQTHPCDGVPPTTGTVVEGTRTLTWCWDGRDTNGNATTVTAWTAMVDNVRRALNNVTVGGTANAQGKRLYSAQLVVTPGTRLIQIAGTNAVREAVFSATFTVTVTQAPAGPSVSEIRGIQ